MLKQLFTFKILVIFLLVYLVVLGGAIVISPEIRGIVFKASFAPSLTPFPSKDNITPGIIKEKSQFKLSPAPIITIKPTSTPVPLKDYFFGGKVLSKDNKFIVVSFNGRPLPIAYDNNTVFGQRSLLVDGSDKNKKLISIDNITVGDLIEVHGMYGGETKPVVDLINKIVDVNK